MTLRDAFHRLTSRLPVQKPRGVAEVGWALAEDKASLIWEAPEPYRQKVPRANSAKSVQACPAAIDFDARQFVVPSPVDLHLGIGLTTRSARSSPTLPASAARSAPSISTR